VKASRIISYVCKQAILLIKKNVNQSPMSINLECGVVESVGETG